MGFLIEPTENIRIYCAKKNIDAKQYIMDLLEKHDLDLKQKMKDEETTDTSKLLSVSALAKKHDIEPKDLFNKLQEAGFHIRDDRDTHWIPTEKGEAAGVVVKVFKGKTFLAWPESILEKI